MCWMIFNFCRRMMFFPIRFFLRPKFGQRFSGCPNFPGTIQRFGTSFQAMVFGGFDSLKRCCWNCKTWFLRLKVLGEDEVPLAAAILIAFGCERFIIWSLRLATELLRNSAPVMKHGGLGHPTKKKDFLAQKKGNRIKWVQHKFSLQKKGPTAVGWWHDTPVTHQWSD